MGVFGLGGSGLGGSGLGGVTGFGNSGFDGGGGGWIDLGVILGGVKCTELGARASKGGGVGFSGWALISAGGLLHLSG